MIIRRFSSVTVIKMTMMDNEKLDIYGKRYHQEKGLEWANQIFGSFSYLVSLLGEMVVIHNRWLQS